MTTWTKLCACWSIKGRDGPHQTGFELHLFYKIRNALNESKQLADLLFPI